MIIRPALVFGLLLCAPAAQAQEGVGSLLEQTASFTPQQKLVYAQDANEQMRTAVKTVGKMLETARRESDVEALQCLTSRLSSIRALLQVSESAELSMKDALGTGQDERAEHEFRKIAVALSKSQQLMAEAERCATSDQNISSGDSVIRVEGGQTGTSQDTAYEEPTVAMGQVAATELDTGMDAEEGTPF